MLIHTNNQIALLSILLYCSPFLNEVLNLLLWFFVRISTTRCCYNSYLTAYVFLPYFFVLDLYRPVLEHSFIFFYQAGKHLYISKRPSNYAVTKYVSLTLSTTNVSVPTEQIFGICITSTSFYASLLYVSLSIKQCSAQILPA